VRSFGFEPDSPQCSSLPSSILRIETRDVADASRTIVAYPSDFGRELSASRSDHVSPDAPYWAGSPGFSDPAKRKNPAAFSHRVLPTFELSVPSFAP